MGMAAPPLMVTGSRARAFYKHFHLHVQSWHLSARRYSDETYPTKFEFSTHFNLNYLFKNFAYQFIFLTIFSSVCIRNAPGGIPKASKVETSSFEATERALLKTLSTVYSKT